MSSIFYELEKNELLYWKLFDYKMSTIDDIKGLADKLILNEFPDLKSDNPVLYIATYSLIMAILIYLMDYEDYEKQNNICVIKKFVDSFNKGNNKKDNQQSPIFDKLKLIDIYDDCLFYYDTFLINPEEICLNAVSLFSYICNKYIDENKLREYIRIEKEQWNQKQETKETNALYNKLKSINISIKESLMSNTEKNN